MSESFTDFLKEQGLKKPFPWSHEWQPAEMVDLSDSADDSSDNSSDGSFLVETNFDLDR